MSGFATPMNEQDEIAPPSCKLVRTSTKPASYQIGQTCVPTSVGNVIMHNICTILKYTTTDCLLLDQFVFEMIIEKYPNCVRSGVDTGSAIGCVLEKINNYLKTGEIPKRNMEGESLADMNGLLIDIKTRIAEVILVPFRVLDQYSIANLQQLLKKDLYGVIKVRGYEGNEMFKKLISGMLQVFFPAPSFGVFHDKDPITVFQNPDANQDDINTFMIDYLSQESVLNTFGTINSEKKKKNDGPTTWGHSMVLKAVFTYQGTGYALIKNSFGEEYGLYDEQVKGLNGHIILPLDMLPEYAIFVPEPILVELCGQKRKCDFGGKKTRRRLRKTMRKRRPNKKTRANRKKATRK